MSQIHLDLRKHLHQKVKTSLNDHIDLCKTVDIPAGQIIAGLAETLLGLVVAHFVDLEITPQEFGQLCHDALQEALNDKRSVRKQKS